MWKEVLVVKVDKRGLDMLQECTCIRSGAQWRIHSGLQID